MKRHIQVGSSVPFGPAQGAFFGMVGLGILGALVGLVRGLQVHPATALFAVFEAGVPALFVGAVLGAIVGLAAKVFRRHIP